MHRTASASRLALLGLTLGTLAACTDGGGLDLDMRNLGNGFDTTGAVSRRSAPRPEPDARGVISYPTYQVAVARRGDTIADVAARLGLSAERLASYNAIPADTALNGGEVIALPEDVGDVAAPAAPGQGEIDIETLAGDAIDEADSDTDSAIAPPGGENVAEPVRHRVEHGETAYSIARRYGVSVRALADWNGLSEDPEVREGQVLLIPLPAERTAAAGQASATTAPPGVGSPTPPPPSAATPLPDEETVPEAEATPPDEDEADSATTGTAAAGPPDAAPESGEGITPPSPEMADQATEASDTARLSLPVQGSIIRDYVEGESSGLDIAAEAGTPVTAADDGEVALITYDNEQQRPILVVRHSGAGTADGGSGELLTVYDQIEDLEVEQGDSVSRGQTLATVAEGDPSALHFEVFEGSESVDPTPYLN